MRFRRATYAPGDQMQNALHKTLFARVEETGPDALLPQLWVRGRRYSLMLPIAILAALSCSRAGATKAHARAMKPVPTSAQPPSAAHQNSDTESVAPKVWELTALAHRKGPSVAS
jgi:hypothetical protein